MTEQQPSGCPRLAPEDEIKTLLQLGETRRVSTDAMMWQVPALSLAAQSFLLTITLSGTTSTPARAIAAFVGAVLALGALRTMLKHRYHEKLLSLWLTDYERRHHIRTLHDLDSLDEVAVERKSWMRTRWVGKKPAYSLWAALLLGLACLDLTLFVLSLLGVWAPHATAHCHVTTPPSLPPGTSIRAICG
jgi:hypothetical protein